MGKKIKELLGAHFSIAKGLDKAIYQAESIDCNAMQIFLHSNRQWKMKDLTQQRIDNFLETFKKSTLKICVVHASYLLSLGTYNKDILEKTIITLTKELEQCFELQIPYLVVHPGAHTTNTLDEFTTQAGKIISQVFKKLSPKNTVKLALENTAGAGKTVGGKLESLAQIKNSVDKKYRNRIDFCFDTCHGFAAGYDFTTPKKYKAFWDYYNKVLDIKNLKVIHMNDSKGGLGSKSDRHVNIGKGKIGLEAFRLILNDSRFIQIPKILETPHEKDATIAYKKDLAVLHSLIK